MKKQILWLFALAIMLAACKPTPKDIILTSGPEVDWAKEVMQAYIDGDWTKYRTYYADTAVIMRNSNRISLDSIAQDRSLIDKIERQTDAVQVLKYANGEQWNVWWGSLTTTYKGTGTVVKLPIHTARQIVQGKIVMDLGYFDPSASIAASQAAAAAIMK